jgi:hypothetical protein
MNIEIDTSCFIILNIDCIRRPHAIRFLRASREDQNAETNYRAEKNQQTSQRSIRGAQGSIGDCFQNCGIREKKEVFST